LVKHMSGKVFGDTMLRLRNISKQFTLEKSKETITALKDVSLSETSTFPPIRRGEFVIVRGPSGGGKTTMLNIIGSLDAPTQGSVELLGSVIDKSSKDDYLSDLRLRHIGYVFQTFNLLSTMSAAENVQLPMTLLGQLDDKEVRSRAKHLLTLVGLRNRMNHLPSELSGGEQQRVTIARSLANNPSILLLDEPTGDLDTATSIEVMDLLLDINLNVGTTCIMVTHNPDLECYADRILYVEDGRFVRQITNTVQCKLDLGEYVEYLKTIDQLGAMAGSPTAVAIRAGAPL